MLAVEDTTALAAAFDDAQSACDALGDKDALRLLMNDVLQTIAERLQPTLEQWAHGARSRGERPGVPNRWKYCNKLAEGSALQKRRAAAYEAVDALLDLAWPRATHASSSTERSQKARADATYRAHENELDEQRKHEAALAKLDAEYEAMDTTSRFFAVQTDAETEARRAEEAAESARAAAARERRLAGLKKWRAKQRAAAIFTLSPLQRSSLSPMIPGATRCRQTRNQARSCFMNFQCCWRTDLRRLASLSTRVRRPRQLDSDQALMSTLVQRRTSVRLRSGARYWPRRKPSVPQTALRERLPSLRSTDGTSAHNAAGTRVRLCFAAASSAHLDAGACAMGAVAKLACITALATNLRLIKV